MSVSGSPLMRRFMAKHGMKLIASRFVAAETLEETIEKVKELNRQGYCVTLDYLGESVETRELAGQSASMVLATLDAIAREQLDSNVSVKLTQLGLLIDEPYCLSLMDRIVEQAKRLGNFIRIDMEDSAVTEATLRIYEQLAARHGVRHVGVVLQAYLYRSPRDRLRLQKLGANVRFVKGAYNEPRSVAFPDKRIVDRQYLALAESHLKAGCYTAIATHDRQIIDRLKRIRFTRTMKPVQVEFQMLYGIGEALQRQLVREGRKVRIYTPFGEHWYAYFSRRLAERPANMLFVLKGLWRK